MPRRERWPAALTVAGSDSGGGAGIQADLKTFLALRVHGLSALTCLTAQNPDGVSGIQAVTGPFLEQQLQAVRSYFRIRAVKTGMLYSRTLIGVVSDFLQAHPDLRVVVDPVMIATSGSPLLKPAAMKALLDGLFPVATVVTPNLDETEAILEHPVKSVTDMKEAAREIHGRYGCGVVIKGGHLATGPFCVDVFFDGRDEWVLEAPRARRVSTHGTGCTFSAALAARLALGDRPGEAVELAKHFVTQAIHSSVRVDRTPVLGFGWRA